MPSVMAEIESCIPALRRYARRLLGNSDEADDLVHDCIVRALDQIHTWRQDGNMRAWLFSILHNLSVSQARRQLARPIVPIESISDERLQLQPRQDDLVASQDVIRALAQLPEEQRAVVLLVSVEDLSYAEVARVLDIPLGTVMSRLSRAGEIAPFPGRRGVPAAEESEVSVPDSPVQEDELHAFVDGRLPADREEAVQRYLRANPEEARRIGSYMHQRASLRAALISDVEPMPPHLRPSTILRERARRSRANWQFAAGVLLALGLGVGGGWLIWGPTSSSANEHAMAVLVQQGFATYTVFAPDARHPVEVPANEQAHLVQWLSNRLHRPVVIPDLSRFGYTLLGGRLVATEQGGAAGLIMYAGPQGGRISLLLRPMRAEFHSADQEHSERSMQLCAWIADGLGYAVVGPTSDANLDRLADQIRDDLAKRG